MNLCSSEAGARSLHVPRPHLFMRSLSTAQTKVREEGCPWAAGADGDTQAPWSGCPQKGAKHHAVVILARTCDLGGTPASPGSHGTGSNLCQGQGGQERGRSAAGPRRCHLEAGSKAAAQPGSACRVPWAPPRLHLGRQTSSRHHLSLIKAGHQDNRQKPPSSSSKSHKRLFTFTLIKME